MGDDSGVAAGGTAAAPDVGTRADDVAALRREIDELRASAAGAAERASEARAEAEALREQVRRAGEEQAVAASEAERLRAELAAATERESGAATRYREAVLRAEPALPPELIPGDSIDAIDRAAEAARAIVERVRERMTQEARVPAGAPPRRAPDTSDMTPDEKIRAGLSRRRE